MVTDIVLHCNGILRHVQLKSSYREATTARVDARTALEGKPSGCILWILFDQRTLELGPYLWFGGKRSFEQHPHPSLFSVTVLWRPRHCLRQFAVYRL